MSSSSSSISSSSKPLVALIGTLDTKQAEYQFATSYLEKHGCNVVVLDASTKSPLRGPSDFRLGPTSQLVRPQELLKARVDSDTRERSAVREALRKACLSHLAQLQKDGVLNAIASLGGSQNTAFATSIMRDATFPIGLPKFMLTTMASGDMSEYLGEGDICIMPSIGDISGSLNKITLTTLQSALAAISGMAHARLDSEQEKKQPSAQQQDHKPMIAISMFGVTTVAVNQISDILKEKGFEPVAFHCTGSGGRSMERLIREGFFAAVVDLTTTEICDHLYGGVLSAGPDRLTAAAEMGVPQVVSVGALDMINFGSLSSLPSKYRLQEGEGPMHRTDKGTPVYEHNSQVTLVRTSAEQCEELGKFLVSQLVKGSQRLGNGRTAAPITIIFPAVGISAMDGEDGVWDDSGARSALLAGMKAALAKHLQGRQESDFHIIEFNLHINSPEFARKVADMAGRIAQQCECTNKQNTNLHDS
ncbi:uncharacterized protein MEPE_06868 [Melanopsichium pennsylvanicum]|uniref:Uncharacterized protein n=2 Tax=Melanopsichium pennsylvanicum TaxID=63383 RepID=A0AAJ5C8M1_9BASI|nr:conserved hypothetical protein [Melanopsichium pennsylvanicum 4]SNX88157.1 uncharacterized protein MEPE_06868 [Melanopsichium pennsylvanicum]